jgi:hypothetical protein
MYMIGHHHIRAYFRIGEMFRDRVPTFVGNATQYIQL